jgi:hypothetical protein
LKDRVLAALADYAAGRLRAPPAIAGAIASHFLAVTSARSLALVSPDRRSESGGLHPWGDDCVQSLLAHQTWFSPRDIRCTSGSVAAAVGGRQVSLAESLAADIVCVHEPIAIAASQIRRGTHINVLAQAAIDEELRSVATVVDEPTLAQLAKGIVDGRQLDEITIFIAART